MVDVISVSHFSFNIILYHTADIYQTFNEWRLYETIDTCPNLFSSRATISWQIPKAVLVTLKIYDVLGREVTTLVNEEVSAGKHEVMFDSHSGEVRNLTSGVYFYQLKAGEFIQTKKMILMK